MRKNYFLLFILISCNFYSCKKDINEEKEKHQVVVLSNPEEDQKRLNNQIANTEKIWDSLSTILRREDLEEKYRDSVLKLYFENRYEQEEIIKKFIRDNPNSIVSVRSLNGRKFAWGNEVTKQLYSYLGTEIRKSEEGKILERFVKHFNEPKVNDRYQDFELPDTEGNIIKISQNVKDYTLLEFWASWCGGCRKKHPQLVETYQKFKDKGFTVIGISGDPDENDWKIAVDEDGLPWINLLDSGGRESLVQYKYGISKIPTNFLIGPAGNIVAIDITPEELEILLDRKLG